MRALCSTGKKMLALYRQTLNPLNIPAYDIHLDVAITCDHVTLKSFDRKGYDRMAGEGGHESRAGGGGS